MNQFTEPQGSVVAMSLLTTRHAVQLCMLVWEHASFDYALTPDFLLDSCIWDPVAFGNSWSIDSQSNFNLLQFVATTWLIGSGNMEWQLTHLHDGNWNYWQIPMCLSYWIIDDPWWYMLTSITTMSIENTWFVYLSADGRVWTWWTWSLVAYIESE